MALVTLNTAEAANRGRAVALLHPATQVPIGIRFFVLGSDSEEFKRITRRQEAARLEKQKKTRRGVYLSTPEENEANALDLLCGLTTGWEEDVKDADGKVTGTRPDIEINEGEFVKFSPESVRRIYSDLGFSWIREQIDSEIGDRRDFLPSAKKS
ncbi:hypothetical protein KI809_10750 [Geobacter pelophilus]|uniref:Phage XkdN-like tail assembly chaperone protein, TAC n=1 Tax=Geoanaerobacter pelophilus TaxID=60036 RepID=A0AAW4L9R3_9BACT|nr:hypothetical protein [Geoanaerobacter pelophilus]MBT0664779.1 hypothetical protein [Geoanaerobacter pelophilus]